MKIRVVGACWLIALVAAGCAKERNAPWLAKAGDIVVESAEAGAYAEMEQNQEFKALGPEQRRALVLKLLVRKAIAADAEREGRGKDPMVARAETGWKFENYPDLYWQETVEKEVKISDEELRAYIDPQARYLLSAMVFGDDAAGERVAKMVDTKLKAGEDFAALARKYSQGFSAAQGGDMGWVEIPNQMIESAESALVAGLPEGSFTQPFKTRLGWTIFQVREKRDANFVFAEKKLQVLPSLRTARIDEAKIKRIAELRSRAAIVYPAELPGAPAGAPAAIVNGFAFPADSREGAPKPHGNYPRDVTPQKQQLEKSINAFLLVQEVERLGLAERPDQRSKLALSRLDALAQIQIRTRALAAITVTDEEAREEHRRYYTPDTYEYLMILVDKRERAEEALRRAQAGESFNTLATEFNFGLLAQSKGQVPLAPTVTYHPEVQKVIKTLADGALSGVLDMGGGQWAVVKRLSMRTFTPPPFEQVAGQINRRLELRKRADATKNIMEEYRTKLKISYNEKLLAQP